MTTQSIRRMLGIPLSRRLMATTVFRNASAEKKVSIRPHTISLSLSDKEALFTTRILPGSGRISGIGGAQVVIFLFPFNVVPCDACEDFFNPTVCVDVVSDVGTVDDAVVSDVGDTVDDAVVNVADVAEDVVDDVVDGASAVAVLLFFANSFNLLRFAFAFSYLAARLAPSTCFARFSISFTHDKSTTTPLLVLSAASDLVVFDTKGQTSSCKRSTSTFSNASIFVFKKLL